MAFWKKTKESESKTPRPAEAAPEYRALNTPKRIIAIASGKGGVGKSTVATNLAVALQSIGKKVGLMDADVYGPSQPFLMGPGATRQEVSDSQSESRLVPMSKYGIEFISMGLFMGGENALVWRAPMANKVIQQFLTQVAWGNLDYLLVDLPPGTGDVQLTLAQQASLSGAVIVTTPQDLALGIAKRGLKMFQQLKVPILGIVENMSTFTCSHCGGDTSIFRDGGGEKLARETGVPLLGSIPLDPAIVNSGEEGLPILLGHPNSKPAQAFLQLASVLETALNRLELSRSPEPDLIELSASGEVLISWPDSHRSVHRGFYLRSNCGCAGCVDENTGKRTLDSKKIPLDLAIQSFSKVGRYAVTFSFSDGHNTGIYPFEKLKALCECEKCKSRKFEQKPMTFSV